MNPGRIRIGRREIVLPADGLPLAGSLAVPAAAVGVVVFAHGSGSSRFSTRNRYVADALNGAGLATLLFDLLSKLRRQATVRAAGHSCGKSAFEPVATPTPLGGRGWRLHRGLGEGES